MPDKRGRPAHPLNPDASGAARLGAEIRSRRLAQGLTLQALAKLTGYSSQHISAAERARDPVSGWFVRVLDRELAADGALLDLLAAAVYDRGRERHEREADRRAGLPPLPCDAPHREVGDEDVDPINRRALLGAGVGAALGLAASAPASAREIDPELVQHWTQLLSLLGRHAAAFGPHDVLAAARREIDSITEHRKTARGELRTQLLCVESRWAGFAAWLSNDTGQTRDRDTWMEHARQLAQESGYRDMAAFARQRQSQWSAENRDARQAIVFAEAALRTPGVNDQTRTLCALSAALGYALANDADACERKLNDAYRFVEGDSPAPPWSGEFSVKSLRLVRANEARCWLWLQPAKAIPLYESALRDWPRDLMRDGAVTQARLAFACASAGEHDRAASEGRKALAIARTTKSSVAARELKQLAQTLAD
jgi:helix-turn-helix protein